MDQFVEKPNAEIAQQYLDSGEYHWNSGMFLFQAFRYLEELKLYSSEIAATCEASLQDITKDLDFVRVIKEEFIKCPDDSIDYAVMEKTQDAVVIPLDAGWNDICSWSALWKVDQKDNQGNASRGDVFLHDTQNCLVHGGERLVATVGLEYIVIVDTKDAVMVAHKDKEQEVKKVVEVLKSEGRPEFKLHREVYRPWGK